MNDNPDDPNSDNNKPKTLSSPASPVTPPTATSSTATPPTQPIAGSPTIPASPPPSAPSTPFGGFGTVLFEQAKNAQSLVKDAGFSETENLLEVRQGVSESPDEEEQSELVFAEQASTPGSASLHAREKATGVATREKEQSFNYKKDEGDRVYQQYLKDDAQIKQYAETYGKNYFENLARVIEERATFVKDPGKLSIEHKIEDAHAKRTLEISEAVRFAEWGARRELVDLKGSPTKDLQREQALKNTIEVTGKIRGMFDSLHALSKHRYRYEEDNFNQRLSELKVLMEKNKLTEYYATMEKAIQSAQEAYNFKSDKIKPKSRRSAPFDATAPEMKLDEKKYFKNYKIEHEGKNVQVTFSCSRSKVPKGDKDAFEKMKLQVGQSLDVALNEYHKGTKDNPIHVQYGKSKDGTQLRQPDLALAIAMQLKKKAILENKIYYMVSPVTNLAIKITPDRDLTTPELDMMKHYANEKPILVKGKEVKESEKYTGASILRRHVDQGEIQRDLEGSLKKFLKAETDSLHAKVEKGFEKEAGRLGGPKAEKARSSDSRPKKT